LYGYVERAQLFTETTNLVSKYATMREQLLALEQKLAITDNAVRQNVIDEGRSLACKRKLDSLQADMEMLYLSIKKKHLMIQSSASKPCASI